MDVAGHSGGRRDWRDPRSVSPSSTVQPVPSAEQARARTATTDARELARRLRSPESGLIGQGLRFILSGGTVALVYLATTTILAELVGLRFQIALAIGFSVPEEDRRRARL